MKRLKIVHVAECFESGVGVYVADVGSHQAKLSDVTIITGHLRVDNKLLESLDSKINLIKIDLTREINPIRDLISLCAMLKVLVKLKPDIVHLHSSKAGFIGRFACLLLGLRKQCFYTPHGLSFLRADVSFVKRSFFTLFEILGSLFSPNVIACSASEAKIYKKNCTLSRVFLCENSVKLEQIEHKKVTSKSLRVINVARVTKQKNPHEFIALASRLEKRGIDFIWVGDSDPVFYNIFVGTNVKYIPSIPRHLVFEEIAKNDLFLTTSLWEGMPLSLIEALSLGLPVVAFDIPGCNDIISTGVNGFLCSSIDEMYNSILKIKSDPHLLNKLSEQAVSGAQLRFSFEGMVTKLYDIYSTCSSS